MPWAKFDDRFQEHPKVRAAWRACPASIGLYVMSVTYCAGNLTDGLVPLAWVESQFRRERDERAAVDALVSAGLWVAEGDGWRVHNYLKRHDSRAKVLAKRAKNAESGKRGGQAKAKQAASETLDDRQGVASDLCKPDTDTTTDTDSVSPDGETTAAAEPPVAVVAPPPPVRDEIDRACDTLAEVGMHVHDRTTVQRLADEHPTVDVVQAAINCARWVRDGRRNVRHPLRALTPFVASDDAPQKGATLRAIPGGGRQSEFEKAKALTEQLMAEEAESVDVG